MMKQCLIIAGGELDVEFASCYIKKKYGNKEPDLIIAADRGLEGIQQLGLQPHLMLGDYDSVSLDILEEYEDNNQIISLQYPTEKDYTDSHLAVLMAMEYGATDICMLGATGTRLDHTWANVGLLQLCLDKNIQAELVDAHNRIRMVKQKLLIPKEEQFGTYVSLLSYTGSVTGITLRGFKYSLEDGELALGISQGVSNEIVDSVAEIKVKSGILCVIESLD